MGIRRKHDPCFNWIPFRHPTLHKIWYWGIWVFSPYDKAEQGFFVRLWKGIIDAIKFFIEVLRAMESDARNRYEGRDK